MNFSLNRIFKFLSAGSLPGTASDFNLLSTVFGLDSTLLHEVLLRLSAISATTGAAASAASPVPAAAIGATATATGPGASTAARSPACIATSGPAAPLALILTLPGEGISTDVAKGGFHRVWLIGPGSTDLAVTPVISVAAIITPPGWLLSRSIATGLAKPCARRAARPTAATISAIPAAPTAPAISVR
jgi:hypothetical protein